jgi:dTDP-4-dehydrorhamnose 3,5-epimerase-like enzyme
MYNDPALDIDWKISPNELLLSGRDQQHPNLADVKFTF